MPVAAELQKTVENLIAAYEGESGASAKYAAFAARADAEGWGGAASLFRAASRAEQIHAANHARVIKQLGGEPKAKLEAVEVGDTLANLKAAKAGEDYEIETMYPTFLAEARQSGNARAIRTMEYALEAEKTHSRLYGEAIALVEAGNKSSWAAKTMDFYVCPTCGWTSETKENHPDCPVCGVPSERYLVIR
jgi:rubrerythrin